MDEFFTNLTNPINAVGHLNYILVILSVSMSNMRWLRVFAIASGIIGVIYYGFIVSDDISAMLGDRSSRGQCRPARHHPAGRPAPRDQTRTSSSSSTR